ncbi:MAG TPA: helix-turn-helix domain-containing protein [Thermoleophilaceae bacterium]
MAEDLRTRLRDLEPAVREFERVKAILEVVESDDPPPVWVYAHGEGPALREHQASRSRGEPRGRRAAQVVRLLRSHPGLTRDELAERLGMRVGYLYELLPTLLQKGYLRERDGTWFVA